jgi:hypothetical protein
MISRSAKALALGVALLSTGGVLYARHVASARRARATSDAALLASLAHGAEVLRVPRTPGGITLDGDTDDPGWTRPPGPAKTGGFLFENGEQARPYTQARLVWGDDYLYLALYASDEDIESRTDRPDAPFGPDDDAIHVVFSQADTEYAFDVSPNAVITDSIRRGAGEWDSTWNSGVHASRELGGSMNHPADLDEEWEVELAIPLSSLGMAGVPGENIGVSFRRCDTPKESARVCSGWGDGAHGRAGGRIVLE